MIKVEKKKKKMADRAVKVAVLEGDFVALCNLGLPFSISYQLQEKGLKLPDALWTVKSSTSGFSVSLFWPSSLLQHESLKKRKRQRKRGKAKSQSKVKVANQVVLNNKAMEEVTGRKSEKFPSRAHHSGAVVPTQVEVSKSVSPVTIPSTTSDMDPLPPSNSESTPDVDPLPPSNSESDNSIDLTTCSNVSFETRDGHPGVRFTAEKSDKTSEWTPVVGRRKKRPQIPPFVLRRFPPDHPIHQSHASCSDDTESEEDEELTIPQSANVFFNIVDGTPGLRITTRNTSSWTPIATRTRSKCKSIASVK